MSPTVQQVYDAARGYLHDTQIPGGEVWTNSALAVHFAEPYRRMFSCLMGVSKRVQRTVYLNLPANTTVLIPSAYNLTDFGEPEMIEERLAQSSIAIDTTSAATPITVTTAAPHGLTGIVEGVISGVASTSDPWGRWFATITGLSTFTLNGSVGGTAGTSGTFTPWGQQQFTEVLPIDMDYQGLDGIPQLCLGNYLWAENRLQFRGSGGVVQLRVTYWASGAAPALANLTINIDNCLDFLACATAANAARANSWYQLADQLKFTAYGSTQDANCVGGLLGDFVKIQVLTLQRGPQRRRLPFRDKRSRFGPVVVG